MKPAIPVLSRLYTGSHRNPAIGALRRWRLIVWLLPLLGAFAVASISGGQDTSLDSDSPVVGDEADKTSGDLEKDDQEEDIGKGDKDPKGDGGGLPSSHYLQSYLTLGR